MTKNRDDSVHDYNSIASSQLPINTVAKAKQTRGRQHGSTNKVHIVAPHLQNIMNNAQIKERAKPHIPTSATKTKIVPDNTFFNDDGGDY